MKNLLKLLAVTALAGVLLITSCDDKEEPVNYTIGKTDGRLNITGLGDYSGYVYVFGSSENTIMLGAKSAHNNEKKYLSGTQISNGQANLKVWREKSPLEFTNFKSDGTFIVQIIISDKKTISSDNVFYMEDYPSWIKDRGMNEVDFVNGKGSCVFEAFNPE